MSSLHRPFSRDRFNVVPVRQAASAAMTVLDALQVNYSAEAQLHGAAAVFLLLSERFNIPAQDAFVATKNLMNAADDKKRPEFMAVAAYLAEELQ